MASRFQFRRANASAWTSANPTLAAGELGFELDTNKFKIGNGTTAWISLGYSTTDLSGVVQKSLIDAKGDLIVGASDNTVAKLTVGTDTYVLTADSTATNGIAWKAASGGGTSTGKAIAMSIVFGG